MSEKPSFGKHLSRMYNHVLGKTWPAWVGGILLGVTNVFIFTYGSPWFIYGGVRLWGLWLFSLLGVRLPGKLVLPWLNTGSLLNIGIIFGAFISCLFLRAFRLRLPRKRVWLLQGFGGGLLMGIGTMMAPGCNVGGYISAISALSLSGFIIFFGLLTGAYTGAKVLIWQTKREIAKRDLPLHKSQRSSTHFSALPKRKLQPVVALVALILSIIVATYLSNFSQDLGVYFLFGITFGFILQRCQFCLTASFRDLFITGSGKLARGAIICMVIGILGFSILQGTGIRNAFLLPVGWHTLLGGYIFGLGMVIAGGCASGMLFRAGEGVIQLILAILGGMISSAWFPTFSEIIGLSFGPKIWLVDALGWPSAIFGSVAFLGVWFIITQWNEIRRRR